MILPFMSQRVQAAAFDPQTGQENLSLRFGEEAKKMGFIIIFFL